eukprot:2274524-Rhodomonas_salina.2
MVDGSGFRVQGSGFRVQGRLQTFGSAVNSHGLCSRAHALGHLVQGSRFQAQTQVLVLRPLRDLLLLAPVRSICDISTGTSPSTCVGRYGGTLPVLVLGQFAPSSSTR